MFRYYPVGFTELRFKGIPIILRDDVPEDELYIGQTNGIWKTFNIKTRRVGILKSIKTKKGKQ